MGWGWAGMAGVGRKAGTARGALDEGCSTKPAGQARARAPGATRAKEANANAAAAGSPSGPVRSHPLTDETGVNMAACGLPGLPGMVASMVPP